MVAQETRPPSAGQGNGRQLLWLFVSIAVALIGLWLLVQSTSMGLDAAESMLRVANGMDSQQFYRLIDAQTAAYRLIGGILLGVGAARALFSLER